MFYFDLSLFYVLFLFIGFSFLIVRNPFILLIIFIIWLINFSYLLFILNFYQFILLINQIYLGALIILQLFMIFLISNYEYIRYNNNIGSSRNANFLIFFDSQAYVPELLIICFLIFLSKMFLILNGFQYLIMLNHDNCSLIFSIISVYDIFLNNFFIFDGFWQFQIYYSNIINIIIIVIILLIVLIGVIINLID